MSNLEDCNSISEVIELYKSIDGDDEFNTEVVYRIAEIVAEEDDDMDNSLEYRNLMIIATDYCDNLVVEIREAIEALDDVYDVEKWDQMSRESFSDWENDRSMSDAASEVDDVNRLLGEFKGFLHDIGEDVTDLYGSDFDFGFGDMMNEAFFGDFWDAEMNIDKIMQGRSQMALLLDQIDQLEVQFIENLDEAEDKIQERVDEEWQNSAA